MKRERGEMSRRAWLVRAGGLAASPWIVNLAGCDGDEAATDADWNDDRVAAAGDVVLGLYPSSVVATGEDAIRRACASTNMSWLSAGDTVLVKIASNSGNLHPAVTSPAAVRGIVAELYARGAARVIVGEQCGVEYVRLVDGEQRFSSSRERLAGNGLLEAIESAGGEAHFFDEQGYADGYFAGTPPSGTSWSLPLMLPKVVLDADHIVYLPRLSSHVLAGATNGLKIAVGWLRDDSRNHLHHDAVSFYEKYVDVSFTTEIRERLRMVVTLAEAVMLHFGPDSGTVYAADPRIVIASDSLASHDAVATALLVHLNRAIEAAPGLHYESALVNTLNRAFLTDWVPTRTGMPWGPGDPAQYTDVVAHAFEQGLGGDRAIARAWELGGGRPAEIRALVVAEQPDAALSEAIVAHGEGTLVLD